MSVIFNLDVCLLVDRGGSVDIVNMRCAFVFLSDDGPSALMIVLAPPLFLVNVCMWLNADPCFLKPKGIKYQVLSWAMPDLPCPPITATLTTLYLDSGCMFQRDESMSSFTWKKRYAILPTVMQALQSPDEHPRQPQLTHCISCPSFNCSFGTRQIHVERKFVSLV